MSTKKNSSYWFKNLTDENVTEPEPTNYRKMTIYSDGQFVFEGIIDLAVGTTTQSVDSTYTCYHRAITLGMNFSKIINLQVTFCGDEGGMNLHNSLKEYGMQYNKNVKDPTKAIYIWAIIEKANVKNLQNIRFSFLVNGYC